MRKDHRTEKSNTEKLEESKIHAFKPQCTSLTLQSKNSMQLPESQSTITYKEKSRGLMARAIEHFRGVDVLRDGEHTGTSNGHAVCLVV